MLKLETEYILEMHGFNANNEMIEGMKSSIEFTTPTCWDILGNNLQKCRKQISKVIDTNDIFFIMHHITYNVYYTYKSKY